MAFRLLSRTYTPVYSLLIDTYAYAAQSRRHCRPLRRSMWRKAEWSMKWMDRNTATFGERLVAFAVEGLFFSGSFCAIFG